jgi:oligopeptide/dipeptide ABC transporter ATP-binding protein
MTAGQIVGEPLTIHALARGSKKADRVAELFHRVGLRPDQMRRYPHEFSGGQRQRLAIARALSVDPDLIVADESVSALDVSIQASIINLMMDIQKEKGLAFLFIAHDIAVVEHISDRIAVMYLGRIVEMGPRAQIVTAPRHPYTKALLSAVPVPDPNRKPNPFRLKGDVPSPINPPSGCTFHTRCPLAFDRCRAEAPAMREVAPGQLCACHLDCGPDAP